VAKAVYQRNQKVWVESVGAWAVIERVVPVWAKGFEEPVRVTYDVGLGREFQAHELKPEDRPGDSLAGGRWRLLRGRNKWQEASDCAHHPYPGTHPVVVTDATDWGGWRVPGAEYDRDPQKVEYQARLIVMAPQLLAICKELSAMLADAPEDAPAEIQALARRATAVNRYLDEIPMAVAAPADQKLAAE
jgi:hypothetical protein